MTSWRQVADKTY